MTFVNVLVIFLAAVGLFFAASIVYGLLSTRKDKPARDTVTVQKGYLTSVSCDGEERPYVFSSPKLVRSERNSSIFMLLSAMLDGREFPQLKVGEARVIFIQAVNNSSSPFTPSRLQNLIIERNGETADVPPGPLPAELPRDVVMTVRNRMGWGPVDFASLNRTSSMSSFVIPVSDLESFVRDVTSVSVGYRKEAQDILLSESSFVSIDRDTFAECIRTAVLEWTKAVRDRMDSGRR